MTHTLSVGILERGRPVSPGPVNLVCLLGRIRWSKGSRVSRVLTVMLVASGE